LQEQRTDDLTAHPATVPWGSLLEGLRVPLPPSAVAVMAGIGYTPPHDLPLARSYERAFGFLAALGFHCESFCSDDPHVALDALQRQWDLMARRWKVQPVFSVYPVRVPGEQEETLLPVELAELDATGVLVRSVAGSTRVTRTEFLAARRE